MERETSAHFRALAPLGNQRRVKKMKFVNRTALKYALPLLGFGAIVTGMWWWAQPKPTIVVILPSDTNPYWIEVARGAKDAAEKFTAYNVSIQSSPNMDSAGQTSLLKSYLFQGRVKALVFGPANDSEPVPTLAEYTAHKVPLVVIDTALNPKDVMAHQVLVSAFIASDNLDGGRKAAHAIAKLLQGRASKHVLLIEGSRVHQSAIDRAGGFNEAAAQDGLDVVAVNGEWKRDKAHDIVMAQFSQRRFDAVFASNDDMALGAVAALKERGTPKSEWPIVIGFDATRDGLSAVAAGDMYGTIQQDPTGMGFAGVEAAVKLLNHDPSLVTNNILPVTLLTR